MNRRQYYEWWANMDYDPENVPEPQRTLARHILELWGRLDNLLDPEQHEALHEDNCKCFLTRCACAYDHPDAVCGIHEKKET